MSFQGLKHQKTYNEMLFTALESPDDNNLKSSVTVAACTVLNQSFHLNEWVYTDKNKTFLNIFLLQLKHTFL